MFVMQNEDTNRTFDISFRTPVHDDKGVPHVFEHATLGGSKKYPSKSLFFNLTHQTYNTYMNAMTTDIMTTYPIASLSEDQLLRYADYYTDSVFNPSLMQDKSIFEEEAWRYAMADADSELTLAGTVYTEMQGAYTIQRAAQLDFMKTLFPGSQAGNSFGGDPLQIPNMTWEDLKNYHDAYYHPSNSLTCLYGKLEQVPAFMELLDGYFSAFEKKEFTFADEGYVPIKEPVAKTHPFAVEATSDTQNGAVVYYGLICEGATYEDEQVMDLLTTLLNESSSGFQQEMKKRLPAASAGCYYINSPEMTVVFRATGMNADQAETFKEIVDESLAKVKENGFDKHAVEAVAAAIRLDLLLTTEESNVGANLLPNVAYTWADSGDINAYSKYVDNTANFMPFYESGAYQALVGKYLLDNPRTALSITKPEPGLTEKQAEALSAQLAEKKAAMTPEEIQAIVEQTALAGEKEGDASEYVARLQAVTVDSLPVERRTYEIADQTGEDGVRRIHAKADVTGVGQALLLLDAGALLQEDIHWFKLYTNLLGEMDTKQRSNAELAAQMTRYLYEKDMRISVLTGESDKECLPKMRVSFIAMDEDLAPAYELVYEILFESKLDDAQAVADTLSQVKTALKQQITNASYNIQVYRAFAAANPGFAYFNYANFLDYYAFLEQTEELLAKEPEAVLAKLAQVRDHLKNSDGLISGFAGNEESYQANLKASDAFIQKLGKESREHASYDLPVIAHKEALVVDSAVNYNLLYATFEELGIERFTGDLDAVTRLVSDTWLYPLLRDQYGAYGVDHGATEDGVYILSFRDPNVKETFDVYGNLPKLIEEGELTEDVLQGYILSAYSGYALSTGELAGAKGALISHADGKSQDRTLKWMEELKAVTPEQVKAYAAMYQTLFDKGLRSTSGGAKTVAANESLYETVFNPFAVKAEEPVALGDVTEEDWYFEAVNKALEMKLMDLAEEGAFKPNEPATLGQFAKALFVMVGGSGSEEESIASLSEFGLLPATVKAEDPITREQVAEYLITLFVASQYDFKADIPAEIPEFADRDQVKAPHVDMFNFLVGLEIINLREGDLLAPAEPITRGELAYLLTGL
ncbi:MAG: hypothetical protein GXZ04_05050 [Clostridiales bacterium]|nr:hypothetical protein [Clostridiales bacterium]